VILYAAYVNEVLLDQVPANNEEAAIAKLSLDYPNLKGEVTLEVVDGNYQSPKPEPAEKIAAATMVEPIAAGSATTKETSEVKGQRPFAVIEGTSIEINIVTENLDTEALKKLEEAAEKGLVIAKKKGN